MPWESVGRNWHYEAIIASVIAALLCMAWLLALHTFDLVRGSIERYCRDDVRYAVTAVALILAQVGIVAVMARRGNGNGDGFIALALMLAVGSALSGWLAAYGEVNDCSITAPSLVAAGFLSLAVFLSFLGLDVGLKSWEDVGTASVSVLGVVFFISCLEACARAIAGARKKGASELEPEAGPPEPEFVRQPGYDLSAPSAQGEIMLTHEVRELAATMLADWRNPPNEADANRRATLIRLLLQPWEVKGDEVKMTIPRIVAGSEEC
jgi:hypothetical protein